MKTKHGWSAADALTDEEIHAAAVADPDALPLTEERLVWMRRARAYLAVIAREPEVVRRALEVSER